MAKKSNKILQEKQSTVQGLKDSYKRFKHIYDNGCTDPFWSDGTNINLVRNHIMYYKRMIDELFKDNFIDIPDEYFYPTPMALPNNFMAVTREVSPDGVLTANKTLSYNEVVKFTAEDWREMLSC